ncbi:MAG: hypothetical protein DVB31_05140 [Verrucomicrobia bacterium]|nr:MAG: hypothetical protein DVB31_05140 [Verrucomicrobiota bacterium]
MNAAPLMPSLARVVRGLSALFWGLPLALLACVKTALGDTWRVLGVWGTPFWRSRGVPGVLLDAFAASLPGLAALALLLYGLRSLVRFQPQERVWTGAVERASLLNLVLLGLLPFAHWWNVRPSHPLFLQSLGLFVLCGIAFMLALNGVLSRLAAMLPDEVLRSDTRLFTRVNGWLIGILGVLLALEWISVAIPGRIPVAIPLFLEEVAESRNWLLTMLALLPLALTMTLLWKAKEAILTSVFRGH